MDAGVGAGYRRRAPAGVPGVGREARCPILVNAGHVITSRDASGPRLLWRQQRPRPRCRYPRICVRCDAQRRNSSTIARSSVTRARPGACTSGLVIACHALTRKAPTGVACHALARKAPHRAACHALARKSGHGAACPALASPSPGGAATGDSPAPGQVRRPRRGMPGIGEDRRQAAQRPELRQVVNPGGVVRCGQYHGAAPTVLTRSRLPGGQGGTMRS